MEAHLGCLQSVLPAGYPHSYALVFRMWNVTSQLEVSSSARLTHLRCVSKGLEARSMRANKLDFCTYLDSIYLPIPIPTFLFVSIWASGLQASCFGFFSSVKQDRAGLRSVPRIPSSSIPMFSLETILRSDLNMACSGVTGRGSAQFGLALTSGLEYI